MQEPIAWDDAGFDTDDDGTPGPLFNAGQDGIGGGRRGQAGRFPIRSLASALRSQGFLPTRHFLARFTERAHARGIRLDPRAFGHTFAQARHFRQTRAGYTTRIALLHGLPILYRVGGKSGNRVVLVGVLPEGTMPPVVPVAPPRVVGGGRSSTQTHELELAARSQTSGLSYEVVPALHPARIVFADAVRRGQWQEAYLNINYYC